MFRRNAALAPRRRRSCRSEPQRQARRGPLARGELDYTGFGAQTSDDSSRRVDSLTECRPALKVVIVQRRKGGIGMSLVVIEGSVGKNGKNLAPDVVKIGAALVAVGPDRGGIFGPPLSVEGLGQAIEMFQSCQRLPVRDGRVDPGGATLRRINEILNPGAIPPAPPTPEKTGNVRPMASASGLATAVDQTTWTPIEASLVSEMVFRWTGINGRGRISYFELDESAVPRWFGVLVPDGVNSFDKIHIFFHPTPAQAGYQDAQYNGLGNWSNIFHYLSDRMGSQFCAAGMGRVMVMPLMTQGAAESCGILPQRWEAIIGQMLGMVKSGDMSGSAPSVSISSVVVSSFSSGITYSHYFRSKAKLGERLVSVIDFDGGISTYRHLSGSIRQPAGRVVRMQQMPSNQATLGILAGQNTFPLARPRWGGPYANLFAKNEGQALLQIHGTIPQTMMFIAARRAG
jgi:hypothetical protein